MNEKCVQCEAPAEVQNGWGPMCLDCAQRMADAESDAVEGDE